MKTCSKRKQKKEKDYVFIYNMFYLSLNTYLPEKCEREYQFHPDRKWAIDYFFPRNRLAVEVEGGAYTHGRHTRGKGFIQDMEKYNEMAIRGISLLRVTPEQVERGDALRLVERWFVEMVN